MNRWWSAAVFAFLTDPEKIIRWMGAEATTQAHPGGLYLVEGIGGRRARGAFREVAPVIGSPTVSVGRAAPPFRPDRA